MESFRRLRSEFRFLGLVPLSQNRNDRVLAITKNCLTFIILGQQLAATTWYFAFDAQTFQEHVQSFFYASYALKLFTWYTIIFSNRFEYVHVFAELDGNIAQRSTNPVSRTIYQKAHRKLENLSQKINILLMTLFYLFIIPFMLMAIYQYISSGYSTEHFKQLVPSTYPFDWRTPIGYAVCMLSQSISGFAILKVKICSMVSILGHCIYAAAFISDLEMSVRDLDNEFSQTNGKQMNQRKQLKIKTKFIENIQFYLSAREFTNRLLSLDRGLVFSYILFAVVSYCGIFLQINSLLAAGDWAVILQELLPTTCTTLSLLYALCHFGDYLTGRFEDVGEAFYGIPWYQFPLDMQKDLQFVIAAAQKEVHLRGYAGTTCTRELYKKVINTTYSYYTVLREFDT